MTLKDFIKEYLRLEAAISVQDTLRKTVDEHIDSITAEQASLSTQHLDSLTPLRAGQTIEIAQLNSCEHPDWSLPPTRFGVAEVMQAEIEPSDMEIVEQIPAIDPADLSICITVWVTLLGAKHSSAMIKLAPQPGHQWRYPADCAATLAVPQEARS